MAEYRPEDSKYVNQAFFVSGGSPFVVTQNPNGHPVVTRPSRMVQEDCSIVDKISPNSHGGGRFTSKNSL